MSAVTRPKAGYGPYRIKSIVEGNSIKALAQKLAVRAPVSPPTPEKCEKVQPREPFSVLDSDDDIIEENPDIVEEKPDIIFVRTPEKRAEASSSSVTDSSYENESPSPAKKQKKKKLTKKEKAALEAEEKKLAEIHERRKALERALLDDNDVSVEPVQQPPFSSNRETTQIFVFWRMIKYKFNMASDDTFDQVFEQMAEKMEMRKDQIIIFHNHDATVQLKPFDRFRDIKNDERMFIVAPKRAANSEEPSSASEHNGIPAEFLIHIMVQAGEKSKIKVPVDKRGTLKELMDYYAQVAKKDVTKLRFKFDGDTLKPEQRIEDLDLEGGEVFDVSAA